MKDMMTAIMKNRSHIIVQKGDIIKIRGAKRGAKLLHRKERNYFSVLREKLSWGESLRR